MGKDGRRGGRRHGDAQVWALLPSLVAPGGNVLLFGGCAPKPASFDAARIHYSEISLIGRSFDAGRSGGALALLESGAVDRSPSCRVGSWRSCPFS